MISNSMPGKLAFPVDKNRLKIEFRKECWFDSGHGHQHLFS